MRDAPTCATREGRACRGRLVGVRLWNADASHTQFWQRPMWLRRPEYRATPQSVFAKVQGRESARRREGVVGADVLGRPRVRGVPAGAFAYTARRGRRALPVRHGRAALVAAVSSVSVFGTRMLRIRSFGKDRCGYDARNTGLRQNRSLPRCRDGNRRGGAERGRGGRPRPPACPWRPRGRLRVHGAPGTSRPTMCADMARSVVGADVLGRPRVRGVPVGVFAYTARRGRRALPCATREGRACRGRLVGVRLWNADASHTQFWQRPMWLRRPEYRATPQSVFAKVQGREPARRRGAW